VEGGNSAILWAKLVTPLDEAVNLVEDETHDSLLDVWAQQELPGLCLDTCRGEEGLGCGEDDLGGLYLGNPLASLDGGEVEGGDAEGVEVGSLVLDDGEEGADHQDDVEGRRLAPHHVKEWREDVEAGALPKSRRELDKDVQLAQGKVPDRIHLLWLGLGNSHLGKGAAYMEVERIHSDRHPLSRSKRKEEGERKKKKKKKKKRVVGGVFVRHRRTVA